MLSMHRIKKRYPFDECKNKSLAGRPTSGHGYISSFILNRAYCDSKSFLEDELPGVCHSLLGMTKSTRSD